MRQDNYKTMVVSSLRHLINVKVIFLASLVLYCLFHFDILTFLPDNQIILWFKKSLFILSLVLGTIAFYIHKNDLKRIENDKEKIIANEKKRWNDFPTRYPKLNIVPLVRIVFRWIYAHGWFYVILLLIILMIGLTLRMYRLDNRSFFGDEYQVVDTAAGKYFSGQYKMWDWNKNELSNSTYTRAWPHTWLIAQAYRIFGISEWSSRLVSVAFGTLLILFSYIVAKGLFKCKDTALLFSSLIALSTYFIELSRFTRMYILFITTYLIAAYFLYLGLTEGGPIRWKQIGESNKIKIISRLFYLITGFLILYLSYVLHISTIIFSLSFFLFCTYIAITRKDIIAIIIVLIGSSILLYFIVNIISTSSLEAIPHSAFITVRTEPHYVYWKYILKFPPPFDKHVTKIFIFCIVAATVVGRMKDKKILIFLLLIILPATIFFVYFSNRYATKNYISNIIPFTYALVIYSYVILVKFFSLRRIKYLFLIIPVIFSTNVLIRNFDSIYWQQHGDFRTAYRTIINNYKPDEVIFGQYLRTYYLKDLENNFTTIDMSSYHRYTFVQFREDLMKFSSGWITWETSKYWHLEDDIRLYCRKSFKKVHGSEVDKTNVEVYYFEKDKVRCTYGIKTNNKKLAVQKKNNNNLCEVDNFFYIFREVTLNKKKILVNYGFYKTEHSHIWSRKKSAVVIKNNKRKEYLFIKGFLRDTSIKLTIGEKTIIEKAPFTFLIDGNKYPDEWILIEFEADKSDSPKRLSRSGDSRDLSFVLIYKDLKNFKKLKLTDSPSGADNVPSMLRKRLRHRHKRYR